MNRPPFAMQTPLSAGEPVRFRELTSEERAAAAELIRAQSSSTLMPRPSLLAQAQAVGPIPPDDALREQAKAMGLTGNVRFPRLTDQDAAAVRGFVGPPTAEGDDAAAWWGVTWWRFAWVDPASFAGESVPRQLFDDDGRWRRVAGRLWVLVCRECGRHD